MSESLTVLLPMYNEEENVEKIISKLDVILKSIFKEYTLLIVESASEDRTAEIVDDLAKRYKAVDVIHQSKRKGLGNAIKEGFAHCNTDMLLYMDADGPFDLEILRKIFPLDKETKVLIGVRKGVRESFKRRFFSWGYNGLINLLFGLNVKDINFSFKLLRREVRDKLNLISDRWFIDAELLCEIKRAGYKMKEIEIPYLIRAEGQSKANVGFKLAFDILKEMFIYYRTYRK